VCKHFPLIGCAQKEFPRFRSLSETQFPLGNPLFHAAVSAARFSFVRLKKEILRILNSDALSKSLILNGQIKFLRSHFKKSIFTSNSHQKGGSK
jgi:hypothetical protein